MSKMAISKMACGCRMYSTLELMADKTVVPHIDYCPMHAAARKMLDAIRNLSNNHLGMRGENSMVPTAALNECRNAIEGLDKQ